jgi:S-adenosylmethionine uptake transporter
LIVAVLAKLFMKEPLGRRQLAYIMIGFAGSVLAVNPFSADLSGGSALGWILLPTYPLLFSITTLYVRRVRQTEGSISVAFFAPTLRIIVFLPVVLFLWKPMTIMQIALLIGSGVLVTIGNLMFNNALARADSAIIAPLHYSQLILGALFGYVFFSDVPAWHVYLGSAIIIASGLAGAKLAYRRERLLTAQPV